jgi:Zn-dependent protease
VTPSIPLGRIGGVPVRMGPSWLVVAPVVAVGLFAGIDRSLGSLQIRALVAAVGTVALFGSVLVHEAGHALVARRLDVEVRRIVLFLFGGYTEMEVGKARPSHEALISFAGPVVSAVLGLVFWGCSTVGPDAAGVAQSFRMLAVVNGAVAVFNLLPGSPLDGGRITRSLLVMSGLSVSRAGAVTTWLGVGIGSMLVVVALVGNAVGRPGALIALPVGAMAAVLAWAARPTDRRTAADAMRPAPPPVGEDTPMASLDGRRGVLPVVSSGRVVGLVTARRTAGIVAEQMDPVLPADIVAASAPLAEVVALVRRNGRTIIVVGGTATVVGLIHPEDLQGDVLSEFEEI